MKNSNLLLLVLTSLLFFSCTPSKQGGLKTTDSRSSSVPNGSTESDQLMVQRVRITQSGNDKVLEFLVPEAPGEPSTIEKWAKYTDVISYPKGTNFYHWGPEQDVRNWAERGISKEDIDRDIRTPNASNLYGGGFYVSVNPLDSFGYGSNVLVAQPQHDVLALDIMRSTLR